MGVVRPDFPVFRMVTKRCACGVEFETIIHDRSGLCGECREREERRHEADRRRAETVAATVSTIPEFYRWATFEGLAALPPGERAKRVKDKTAIGRAKAAIEAKRVVLSGVAGMGKTVLASCLLRAWADRGERGLFTDAFRLANERAHSPLGHESPTVDRAMRCPAVLIDDLLAKRGTNTHDARGDVIFERHQRARRTVITLGHTVDDVRADLGDGIARRVFEDAFVIDLQQAKE